MHIGAGIEWDALEFPSQFMEHWVYDPFTLHRFARHYLTGEPLTEVGVVVVVVVVLVVVVVVIVVVVVVMLITGTNPQN